MPITIIKLAQLAGVSDATVSLVLSGKDRGRVSPARREQILQLARRHGYRSNLSAKGLVEGRTYRIALCLEGTLASHAIIGEFSLHVRFGLFTQGIQDAGYAIEVVQVDSRQAADRIGEDLCAKGVDGFVLLSWRPTLAEKVLLALREKRIPAVASGTSLPEGFTWTNMDGAAVFREAAHSLIAAGHRRIALLDIVIGTPPATFRQAFVNTVEKELGCDGRRWIFHPKSISYESARRVTEQALDEMKDLTGLILMDNFYGEAVLDVLRQRGIKPGKDIRAIGYGDTVLADRWSPRLSHYGLRVEEQVAFGLDALLEEIRDPAAYQPRHKDFAPVYIARDT